MIMPPKRMFEIIAQNTRIIYNERFPEDGFLSGRLSCDNGICRVSCFLWSHSQRKPVSRIPTIIGKTVNSGKVVMTIVNISKAEIKLPVLRSK